MYTLASKYGGSTPFLIPVRSATMAGRVTAGKTSKGTNVWGLMSIDRARGLIFLPHGSPSYDFYGADRKGKNLFGNSLVVLNADTGKLAWYFQAIHHDTWDYDLESAPVLIDVMKQGEKIPASPLWEGRLG